MKKTAYEIANQEFSSEFVSLMKNSMIQSYYKYGPLRANYPHLADAIQTLKERLRLYEETGNKDYLVDISNMSMIEYMCPKHPNAHFRRCSSEESPGLKGETIVEVFNEVGKDFFEEEL